MNDFRPVSKQAPFGAFTVRGSQAVEEYITRLVTDVRDCCQRGFRSSEYRALIMLGGYGRGEGGVEVVNGEERPHNNLDFMLIANAVSARRLRQLKARLEEVLLPVKAAYQIELDTAAISAFRLRFYPCLVLWYDMRFGHKTILGDAGFVPSLTRFRLAKVPAWDVNALLVNRGTLLLVNEHLLSGESPDPGVRRQVVKNSMKAIIGYGDALLFFLGRYDWSYVERQRRMRASPDVPASFRALYDEAAEFRFRPSYEQYLDRDLEQWLANLREILEPVHLQCECKRLGVDGLTWKAYPETALREAPLRDRDSLSAWVKKIVNLARSGACPIPASSMARLGYRVLNRAGLYALVYPLLAYRLDDQPYRELAATALAAGGTSDLQLRQAYLRTWGFEGDPNAASLLRQHHLPFSENQNGSPE